MSILRRALGDGLPGRRYLINVPGRGYRFVAPVDRSRPDDELPARSTIAGPANNLPASKTGALGREEKIGALLDEMTRHRLITIVGACGVGKTTVALAVAERLLRSCEARSCEDGVWFVDLSSVTDGRLVPNALAEAIGLAVDGDSSASGLADKLRHKKMLLLLDSCEHVIADAASLAEQLLADAPGIHILATSRESLRAGSPGSCRWSFPPRRRNSRRRMPPPIRRCSSSCRARRHALANSS
jgi:hypothetical protein